jgi:hypothetical protein
VFESSSVEISRFGNDPALRRNQVKTLAWTGVNTVVTDWKRGYAERRLNIFAKRPGMNTLATNRGTDAQHVQKLIEDK